MISALRSTSGFFSMRRSLGLGSLVASLGLLAATATAEPHTINATNSDTITSSANGRVQISLTHAPVSASGAMLKAMKTLDEKAHYTWEAPLTKSGATWNTTIDRAGLEALLMATNFVCSFPGAADNGEALEIVMERDDHVKGLGAAGALVGSDPIFYTAPEAPTAPADLALGADEIAARSYVQASRRYDEELSAYAYSIEAERAGAHAYWLDMKTAETTSTWPAATVAAQDKAFADLAALVTQIRADRVAHRAKAEQAIAAWNANNPNAEMPVLLEFRPLAGGSS